MKPTTMSDVMGRIEEIGRCDLTDWEEIRAKFEIVAVHIGAKF